MNVQAVTVFCSCCDNMTECRFCGTNCKGECNDPDSCRACWENGIYATTYDDGDLGKFQTCYETGCTCGCHPIMEQRENIKWNMDVNAFEIVPAKSEPYERHGVFPLLKLPGDVRNKIYNYAFRQSGNARVSANHRGKIQTALLSTCRQVNEEASELPLKLNSLCFQNPVNGLKFLMAQLMPKQYRLVKTVDLELHAFRDFHEPGLRMFLEELAKLNVTEFGLTIKGGVDESWLTDHNFPAIFECLKNLETFKLEIGSRKITEFSKALIADDFEKNLIRPDPMKALMHLTAGNLKRKRLEFDGYGGLVWANKRSRTSDCSDFSSSYQSADSSEGFQSVTTTQAATQAEFRQTNDVRATLLVRYNILENYANSAAFGGSRVHIRLSQAKQAAKVVDEAEYDRLSTAILETLEGKMTNSLNAGVSAGLPPMSL